MFNKFMKGLLSVSGYMCLVHNYDLAAETNEIKAGY